MSRAVVFAYHDVGVRCLSVLLARGVDVGLVVTHRDDPGETIWFESVAELARRHDLPVVTPESPKDSDAELDAELRQRNSSLRAVVKEIPSVFGSFF